MRACDVSGGGTSGKGMFVNDVLGMEVFAAVGTGKLVDGELKVVD